MSEMPKTISQQSITLEFFGHAPVVYETTINNNELLKWFRDAEVNNADNIEYHIFRMLEDYLKDSGLEADSLSIRATDSNDEIYNASDKEPKITIETIINTPVEGTLKNCFTVKVIGMWRGVYGSIIIPEKAKDFDSANLTISIDDEKLVGVKYNNEDIKIDRDPSQMRDKGSCVDIYYYDEDGHESYVDIDENYSDYLQTAPVPNTEAINVVSGIENIHELTNKIIKLFEESEWSDEKEISSIINITDPIESNSESSIGEIFSFNDHVDVPLTYLPNKKEIVILTDTDDLGGYLDLESLFKLLAKESSEDFKVATVGWFDDFQRVVYFRKTGSNLEFADLTRDDWADSKTFEEMAKDAGYSPDDESLWEYDDDGDQAPEEGIKDDIYDSLMSDPTLLAPEWFQS